MTRKSGLLKYFLVFCLIDEALLVPTSTPPSSDSSIQESESKLLEIKLPVQFENTNDLIAWVRNAMRSMASRIDITLATVDDPAVENRESSSSNSENRLKQRDSIVPPKHGDKRPDASSGALVTTYASLFGAGNSFASIGRDQNNLVKNIPPRGNNILGKDVLTRDDNNIGSNVLPRRENDFVSAYLPLLFDDIDISKFRDEALRKYYLEIEAAKQREKSKIEIQDQTVAKHSRAITQKPSEVSVDNDDVKSNLSKDLNQEKKLIPVISVPFEAYVTITRENVAEPPRPSLAVTRDPPDEFPPYFERESPRRESITKPKFEKSKKIKDSSQKQQIGVLGDFLRTIGLTRKLVTKPISPANSSPVNKVKKPSTSFTPPPQFQFEDEPQRQRTNETSQRQEFDEEDEDEDYEESMGSLGSITDLLPLVIPILEDIIDPETETDLGEVLAAALPLLQGLSEPEDEDAPDIIGMIGPILTNILAGKDGQGSDVAAILNPLVTLIAPLIGPVLGPLIGPTLTASSNPPDGNGSSLATLINAVVGPLVQPIGDGKKSPLSVLTAGVVASLSKQLMPGAPGGLDIGALVGAILSGIISGTSAGLSGGLHKPSYGYPYLPYGAGPAPAGSVNTGFHAPPSQRPNRGPGNNGNHQKIVNNPTRRPYSTLPQKLPPGPHPRPPNYVQHGHPTGPYQAGTSYAATGGGSSYLPYGNDAVPANSANPIAVIGTAVKDVLSAGIKVVSSVINAAFGIIGGSSGGDDDDSHPVYGPPAQGYGPPAQGYAPPAQGYTPPTQGYASPTQRYAQSRR